ncbi:MAG: hypothetical protein D6702_13050 [Planctomycetota bacterium]|nr:MAG: hypothetical protein D6702_13050 [Planctomycetota bacterium]
MGAGPIMPPPSCRRRVWPPRGRVGRCRPPMLLVPSLVLALLSQAPPAAADGAVTLAAGGRPVLVYRSRRVEPPAGYLERVAAGNRIYARARSGYIHPLYGLDGEELTLDWSVDHPHHRGIYWAWPEVRWGERQGDLHALQEVFSRPVGEAAVERRADGTVALTAHNLWLWADAAPVVFERVRITVREAAADRRVIDLELRFEALADGITLARRHTDTYGGLNVRLAPVDGLAFGHHAQAANAAEPPRAWSTATGTWRGGRRRTTLAILEHPANPDFPGDFVTYEYLPWLQPAFPRAGSRWPLRRGEPLTLRYRLLILPGDPDEDALAAAAAAYEEER